jgi:hypothetical protein
MAYRQQPNFPMSKDTTNYQRTNNRDQNRGKGGDARGIQAGRSSESKQPRGRKRQNTEMDRGRGRTERSGDNGGYQQRGRGSDRVREPTGRDRNNGRMDGPGRNGPDQDQGGKDGRRENQNQVRLIRMQTGLATRTNCREDQRWPAGRRDTITKGEKVEDAEIGTRSD